MGLVTGTEVWDRGVGGVPLEPDRLNTSFHLEHSEHTRRSFPSPSLFFSSAVIYELPLCWCVGRG